MRLFFLFVVISTLALCHGQECVVKSVTTSSGTSAKPGPYCPGEMIFEETFDTLDHSKWHHENTLSGGGNWEFQWYSNNRSNSFVKDGILHIRPSLLSDQFGEGFLTSGTLNIHGGAPADQCTNPAWFGCERAGNPNNLINPTKSARLRTVDTFRFAYGKLEVRAKMPLGDWLWPAIWLMPAHNAYGSWPSSGEIDLVESRGNRALTLNNVNIGVEQAGSTLHFGPYPDLNGWPTSHYESQDPAGFHASFKSYQLEWTPNYMVFSIDNREVGRVTPGAGGFWERGNFGTLAPNVENPWRFASKMAPFDQQFYLIINLAVGGTNYFPDGATNPDPKPWNNNSPTAMKDFYEQRDKWLRTWNLNQNQGADASLQVDYVRVWAL